MLLKEPQYQWTVLFFMWYIIAMSGSSLRHCFTLERNFGNELISFCSYNSFVLEQNKYLSINCLLENVWLGINKMLLP